MFGVIKYLHLESRVPCFVEILRDKIDDAAIAARRNSPLELQFEVAILFPGNKVAGLTAYYGSKRRAVYFPRLVWKGVLFKPAPGIR